MTAEETARSPLAHRAAALAAIAAATKGAVTLAEVAFLTQVDVRVEPPAPGGIGATEPLAPNLSERDGDRETLWLGPDERLVVAPPETTDRLLAEIEHSLAEVHHRAVDVSANRAVLDLGGTRLLDLLSKGCSLDLHPSVWANGSCAQTLLAKVQVILQRREAQVRIFVRPSFADYVVDWLLNAASEYRES